MSGTGRAKIVLGIIGIVLWACMPAAAQTAKRLWVLAQPDEAIEYGLTDFSPKQKVKIPPAAVKSPESFAINGKGQMLFVPGFTGGLSVGDQVAVAMKVWYWDGQVGSFLDRAIINRATPAGTNLNVLESVPQWALSADGQRIFWFTNLFKKVERKDSGGEESVDTRFMAFETDPAGAKPQQFAEFAFPPCKCETLVCSESCPEADFWWPDAGVSDFFLVTHRIEGQTSVTYQASYLYRKSQGKWSASKLPMVLESILDAAQRGEILVHALPDAACCGWDNESDDQTLLTRGGKSMVLFDERKQYANPDYDVSFFTSNALLSPNAGFAAMTITSSLKPGMELRLADGGKANATELARIRQSLKECPSVEILKIEDQPRSVARIPNASLVGWVNDKEILLVQGQLLGAFDIESGARRQSRIPVLKESLVFLR